MHSKYNFPFNGYSLKVHRIIAIISNYYCNYKLIIFLACSYLYYYSSIAILATLNKLAIRVLVLMTKIRKINLITVVNEKRNLNIILNVNHSSRVMLQSEPHFLYKKVR